MPSETYTPDGRRVEEIVDEHVLASSGTWIDTAFERFGELTDVNPDNGDYLQITCDDGDTSNPMIGTFRFSGDRVEDTHRFARMIEDHFEDEANESGVTFSINMANMLTDINNSEVYNFMVEFIYDGFEEGDVDGYTSRDVAVYKTWMY